MNVMQVKVQVTECGAVQMVECNKCGPVACVVTSTSPETTAREHLRDVHNLGGVPV